MRPVPSPHRRSFVLSGARLRKGRALAVSAKRWMEGNEPVFRALYGYMKQLQGEGARDNLRSRALLWLEDTGQSTPGGRKLWNGDWAGVERYMVLLDPTLDGDPVSMRDSWIDCFGLLPVSWLPDLSDNPAAAWEARHGD